jgi:hypothetical protein
MRISDASIPLARPFIDDNFLKVTDDGFCVLDHADDYRSSPAETLFVHLDEAGREDLIQFTSLMMSPSPRERLSHHGLIPQDTSRMCSGSWFKAPEPCSIELFGTNERAAPTILESELAFTHRQPRFPATRTVFS